MSYIAEIHGKSPFNTFEFFYIPANAEEPVDQSILTLVRVEAGSYFDFPPVLCGIFYHDPLTFGCKRACKEMNDWKFYSNDKFKNLSNANGEWKDIEKVRKWCTTKSGYRTKIKEIRGYLLNVFDLASADAVKKNIVFPLKEGFEKENFDCDFSVPVHAFKKLEKE